MIAELFPLTDDDPFLHPKEVAKLIAGNFAESLIDWEQANRMLQKKLEELENAGTPAPIIAGHKNLFGNTVCIEVRSSDNPEVGVQFTAEIDTSLELETIGDTLPREDDIEELKELIQEISQCLNYDVEFTI